MQMVQIERGAATNGAAHHDGVQPIQVAGLALFAIGLAVFLASLGLADYRVSSAALETTAAKVGASKVEPLRALAGITYDSRSQLAGEIESRLSGAEGVSEYDVGQAQFWLLKSSTTGALRSYTLQLFLLSLGLAVIGGLMYIDPKFRDGLPGIRNDGIFFSGVKNRGWPGISIGVMLIVFYVLLYWYPAVIVNLVILVDPLSQTLRGLPADQWFLYGTMYTLVILVMGIRMYTRYRHSPYHIVRTTSIMFFQTGFAFLIPAILERFNKPGMDLKNAWPLDYTLFTDWRLNSFLDSGTVGMLLLIWGVILAVVVVPLMTYKFGKRWYCSWVCGCGGLAETLGDPFRQLSNKSLRAWKVERVLIHAVLVFAVVMTTMQIANFVSEGALFGNYTWRVNQAYGFLIGAAFAGVVGTGFYPFMGNRVWCRFGCPLAAILGMFQKFKSRFRITTNGGQCMSCGNCSTYCEMGIDVRWYAQRGQNIIRASCVGCGVCAAVCPRGVLSLENGPETGRYDIVELASRKA